MNKLYFFYLLVKSIAFLIKVLLQYLLLKKLSYFYQLNAYDIHHELFWLFISLQMEMSFVLLTSVLTG